MLHTVGGLGRVSIAKVHEGIIQRNNTHKAAMVLQRSR